MNFLAGLRIIESPFLDGQMLLMSNQLIVPTNRTGWSFRWYMSVLLCGDIRWAA